LSSRSWIEIFFSFSGRMLVHVRMLVFSDQIEMLLSFRLGGQKMETDIFKMQVQPISGKSQ